MSRFFRGWLIGALTLVMAGSALAGAPDESGGLAVSGDSLLIGLPIAAFGLTYLLANGGDSAAPADARFDGRVGGFDFVHMSGSPRHDLGLALLRTEVVTFGLKGLVNEERPNGNAHSFPSSHTSTTFAAAEFVRKEYGWAWGVPAYLAAGFTGWTRVENHEHYWHDVVAGAAIGILSNHDFGQVGPFRIEPGLQSFRKRSSLAGDESAMGVAPGVNLEMRFGN